MRKREDMGEEREQREEGKGREKRVRKDK